jgi:hypothetical protein
MTKEKNKTTRGNASQFYVAAELCRRGYSAVVTLGNTANTDILCSNIAGTKFVHIQVKTFIPGRRTCTVGVKAEKSFGPNFFWILAGIPEVLQNAPFSYYIIPSKVMAKTIREQHQIWLKTPGKKGQKHNDNKIRTVRLPPHKANNNWRVEKYSERWDLLAAKLS